MDPIKDSPEKMEDFFNARADSYDEHMADYVEDFAEFYQRIALPVEPTKAEVKVLDLGCGTGLELEYIFRKAPQALITGVDISKKMLALLEEKYENKKQQITSLKESYLDMVYPKNEYDYVVSVMSMHHFSPEEKTKLYKKIVHSLKPGGKYIEGDYVVDEGKEQRLLQQYRGRMEREEFLREDFYHLDIPFSLETQEDLFERAGFKFFKLIYAFGETAVYTGQK
ncbi:MAG: class I SAM-dependent methyltransferase [Bacillota bacterium]